MKSDAAYRPLRENDVVKAGDEWLNVDWFMDGEGKSPWYVVDPDSYVVGKPYHPETWREMRRKL